MFCALLALDIPIYEVHLSNIHRREDWRHHSYVSLVATAIIVGLVLYFRRRRESTTKLTTTTPEKIVSNRPERTAATKKKTNPAT